MLNEQLLGGKDGKSLVLRKDLLKTDILCQRRWINRSIILEKEAEKQLGTKQ